MSLVDEVNNHSNLVKLQAYFEAEGLPVPPLPAQLSSRLEVVGYQTFGTRPATPSLYFLERYLAELENQAPPDYLLIGAAGHGVESYALHYYLVLGPLAIFIQLGWGGASTDRAKAAQRITASFEQATRLIEATEQARLAGKLEPSSRLLVVISSFSGNYWQADLPTGRIDRSRRRESLAEALEAVMRLI
jgi:hypothetical protein